MTVQNCCVLFDTVCGFALRRVLPSIANEVLKSVVAQYNAIELIGKREEVGGRVAYVLLHCFLDAGDSFLRTERHLPILCGVMRRGCDYLGKRDAHESFQVVACTRTAGSSCTGPAPCRCGSRHSCLAKQWSRARLTRCKWWRASACQPARVDSAI